MGTLGTQQMTTTRCYPRTTREAFPGDVDYACPIERSYPKRIWATYAWIVLLTILGMTALGVLL